MLKLNQNILIGSSPVKNWHFAMKYTVINLGTYVLCLPVDYDGRLNRANCTISNRFWGGWCNSKRFA